MRRVAFLFLLALAAPPAGAMGRAATPPEPPPLHWAQTRLTIDTGSGAHSFTVEVADTDALRERGLMYRKTMAANAGMIFDFKVEQYVQFWMKNTVLPLDMIFIKADGTVGGVARNAAPFSEALIDSPVPVRAVLEVNAGIADKIGVKSGDVVHAALFPDAKP